MLAGLLVLCSQPAQVFAAQQTADSPQVEKVKLKVAKAGVGEKARVTVWTKNGTKIKGFISQAGTDDFTVRDKSNGQPTTILYTDVAKIDDNSGHSTLRNVLLGVGIGAGAFLAVILIVFASLDD